MLGEIHRLILERFPVEVDTTLSPGNAVIAKLLRTGDESALLAYARWESSLHVAPTATSLDWSDTGLRLLITCRVEVGGGRGESPSQPLLVRTDGEGPQATSYVVVPPELLPPGMDPALLRLNVKGLQAYVTFRRRGAIDRAQHRVTARLTEVPVAGATPCWTPEVVLEVTADPGARSTDSQFPPGMVDVTAEIRLAGWRLSAPVTVASGTELPGAVLDQPRRRVWPYRTVRGRLSFGLQQRPPRSGGIRGAAALTASLLRRLAARVTLRARRGLSR